MGLRARPGRHALPAPCHWQGSAWPVGRPDTRRVGEWSERQTCRPCRIRPDLVGRAEPVPAEDRGQNEHQNDGRPDHEQGAGQILICRRSLQERRSMDRHGTPRPGRRCQVRQRIPRGFGDPFGLAPRHVAGATPAVDRALVAAPVQGLLGLIQGDPLTDCPTLVAIVVQARTFIAALRTDGSRRRSGGCLRTCRLHDHRPSVPGHAEARQEIAIHAVVAGHAPGKHEPDGKGEEDRVGRG